MNSRKIENLGDPVDDGDGTNKKYVDDGDDKLLPRDGSKTMTGDLNMNNKRIINAGGISMYADTHSHINMNNSRVDYVGGIRMYADGDSPIDMNDNKIIGLRDPVDDTDGANKKYVDTENAKQDIAIADKANKSYVDGEIAKVNIDTTPLLPRDGSRSMTGDLGMDQYNIRNCGILLMNSLGVINMNNGNIINLKDPQPSDIDNAASVNFVNNTINNSNVIINGVIDNKIQESEERSIQAVQQENVFEKVMTDSLFILEDDDIHQVAKIDKDFHKVNQQTYQFKIDYDSSIGYYSTRLGINVVYLPIGYYTIVFEMYFSNKIDVDNTSINANSGTLSVNKINTKNSSNHTRSVVNFYKNMIHPSDDELEIDIALKNKTGQSYENDTNIFIVVYGVSGYQNDVDVRLWDRYLYIENKKVNFETSINMVNNDIENVNNLSINNELNMNNRHIKNVRDANQDSDAINLKQLNEKEVNVMNHVTTEFGKVNPVLSNNSDLIKFIYRNLIRNDSKSLLIKELYFPDSVEGRISK